MRRESVRACVCVCVCVRVLASDCVLSFLCLYLGNDVFILYDVVVYYSAFVLLQEYTRLHFQIIDHVSVYGLLVWKETYG